MAKPKEIALSQEELQHILTYDPSTGEFTWNYCSDKSNYWNTRFANKLAGTSHERSVIIRTNGRGYKAHRLAYLYMVGYVPEEVDHINQNPFDNRWENLRAVSHQENSRNRRKSRSNISGVTGVHWHTATQKWAVSIGLDYDKRNLGEYDNFEEAVAVRKRAETRYGFTNS